MASYLRHKILKYALLICLDSTVEGQIMVLDWYQTGTGPEQDFWYRNITKYC
jgi:hypothetical protein